MLWPAATEIPRSLIPTTGTASDAELFADRIGRVARDSGCVNQHRSCSSRVNDLDGEIRDEPRLRVSSG